MNWFGIPERPRSNIATGTLIAVIGGVLTFLELNELLSDLASNRRLNTVITFLAAAVMMVGGIMQFRRGLRPQHFPEQVTPPDSESAKDDHPSQS